MNTHNETNIMETVSEIAKPKSKRGRPRSPARMAADSYTINHDVKTMRGQINNHLAQGFLGAVMGSSKEVQKQVLGCTCDDVMAGSASFPRGFPTCATEIGRWALKQADQELAALEAVDIAAQAMRDGISWRDLRNHFRILRMGVRVGNEKALLMHLLHSLEGYCQMFPGTSQIDREGAARRLKEIVSLNQTGHPE